MDVVINIVGRIGFDSWDVSGLYTDLETVREEFESVANPTSITLKINSPGGNLLEGYAIRDFLKSKGLPITSIGQLVGSIATVIFLAGDKGRRFLRPNARFLVHNPMPAIGIQTDADGYEELASQLRKEEDELINLYNQETGISRDKLKSLMDKDELLTAREAVELGFADAIQEGAEVPGDVAAVAIYDSSAFRKKQFAVINQHIGNSMNADQNKIKAVLLAIGNLFKNEIDNAQEPEAAQEVTETPEVQNAPEVPGKSALELRLEALEQKQAEALAAKEEEITALKKQLEASQKEQEKLVEAVNILEKLPLVNESAPPKPVVEKRSNTGAAWIDDQGVTAYFKHLMTR